MLIFSDLHVILIIKGDLNKKIVTSKIVFKQKCHILIHNINAQSKII